MPDIRRILDVTFLKLVSLICYCLGSKILAKKTGGVVFFGAIPVFIQILTLCSNYPTLKVILPFKKTGFKSKFLGLKALIRSLYNKSRCVLGASNARFCAAMKLQWRVVRRFSLRNWFFTLCVNIFIPWNFKPRSYDSPFSYDNFSHWSYCPGNFLTGPTGSYQ